MRASYPCRTHRATVAPEAVMERVLGIGGVFFKAKDPAALAEWYRKHLGIDVQPWGGFAFRASAAHGPNHDVTVWSLFPATSKYFDPSREPFMVNYRVRDLDALLAALRAEGCAVDERVESSEYGRFGWVMDPEGHRIELWQPPSGAMPG
jgi:predicted enzyme related to lactoylglutathione lyase